MKIENHQFVKETASEKIVLLNSPNAKEVIDPDYLVIHYTAGDTAQSAINWFMESANNPDKIAAHIVLDTDGTITQLVPFNRRANHAGTSSWDGLENFNFHSIGIEIVNAGFVEKLSNGSFRRKINATTFKTYPNTSSANIIKTKHKHKFWTAADNNYWFKFPQVQLNALYKLSKLLIEHYQLITAVGHDDISPARKPDPGPAFPWNEFKLNVLNKTDDTGKIFIVNTTGTNLRAAPTTNAAIIKKLNTGYEVGLIETNGAWNKVYLVNDKKEVLVNNRSIKTIGWIHNTLLDLKVV